MATKNDVIKNLMVMGELYGRQMTEAATGIYLSDLEEYDYDAVLIALQSCRRELQRFPLIADIISRVQSLDGRPGAEEAWAMIPKNEDDSCFVTDEMREASGVAYSLEGDEIAARMAFKETYSKAVIVARQQKKNAKWSPIFGRDVAGRAAAVTRAMQSKRISFAEGTHFARGIEHLMPELERLRIEASSTPIAIENKVTAEEVRALIGGTIKPMEDKK